MGGDAGHSRSKRRQLVSQAHKGWRCEVAENGAATRDWNFAGGLAAIAAYGQASVTSGR